MTNEQSRILKVIHNDISHYNIHSNKKLKVVVNKDDTINIYIGEHLQSKNLEIVEAHFMIMGMMIEQIYTRVGIPE